MKTYSTKAAAKKGAVRQELDVTNLEFLQNEEGRWYWEQPTAEEPVIGDFVHCPHCGVHLDNGARDNECDWNEFLDGHFHVNNKDDYIALMTAVKHQFNCLGCGEDFGPEVTLTIREAGTGIKIEKDRPEQNGIVRPSVGGKCRAIWDACDALYAKGTMPMPKVIKELAQANGWNENNAVIEMYQWRKFNGIIGRQK